MSCLQILWMLWFSAWHGVPSKSASFRECSWLVGVGGFNSLQNIEFVVQLGLLMVINTGKDGGLQLWSQISHLVVELHQEFCHGYPTPPPLRCPIARWWRSARWTPTILGWSPDWRLNPNFHGINILLWLNDQEYILSTRISPTGCFDVSSSPPWCP